jgi:hypothetical protein
VAAACQMLHHLFLFLHYLPLSLLSSCAGHAVTCIECRGQHHGNLRQPGVGAAERDGEVVTGDEADGWCCCSSPSASSATSRSTPGSTRRRGAGEPPAGAGVPEGRARRLPHVAQSLRPRAQPQGARACPWTVGICADCLF